MWRNGFSSWVRAEDVPELAAHLVKPPPLMEKLEPAFPAMSMAARWGKGIVRAGGFTLVIYLLDHYWFENKHDAEFYFLLIYAFMWGWLDGTKQIGVKRPKRTISTRTIVALLCAVVLAFLIYVAATQGTSSVLFRFSISFFATLAAISLVGPAARWINRRF